jgi:hypothetical protein
MDPNAVNVNVTIDDFDPFLTFEDESQWTTPNPQENLPFDPSKSPWLDGTYHLTNVTNATLSLEFEGNVEPTKR